MKKMILAMFFVVLSTSVSFAVTTNVGTPITPACFYKDYSLHDAVLVIMNQHKPIAGTNILGSMKLYQCSDGHYVIKIMNVEGLPEDEITIPVTKIIYVVTGTYYSGTFLLNGISYDVEFHVDSNNLTVGTTSNPFIFNAVAVQNP